MRFKVHEKALVSPNAQIGDRTRIWAFANVQEGAVIGSDCNICDGCFVEKGAVLGSHVTLKNHVCIWDGVTLEDEVFVGAGATFINDRNPRSNRKDAWVLERTVVKKGASIGANATILCGIIIGDHAFVGAGSVVTRDVPPFSLVVGSPARFAGHVCQCGHKMNHALTCVCGKKYQLLQNTVVAL